MRSLIDGGRRRRPRDRHSSRFARGQSTTAGGRDLIRFRRNREVLAREVTVLLLWGIVTVMLVNLSTTLWRVAQQHLAEQPQWIQAGLPALAIVAAAFCLWRARANFLEILDIRREQARLGERLRARHRPEGDDSANTGEPSP